MACRKGKRNGINTLKFEADALENLSAIRESLIEGGYKPSRSVCFMTEKPKFREIFAADFRDRVVHHLLVPTLEKTYEPKFIFDSYACRVGKGTHSAVERLRHFMNSVTRNGVFPAWYLQLDVKSFFMSIDKNILFEMLKKNVEDKVALELAETVIFHNPAEDYVYRGDPSLLENVPPHKSLFQTPDNRGLPIGNLTSQFFANVYLNALDQHVKHVLKAKYYLRYVDDFIILDESKQTLADYKANIQDFLAKYLGLSLKDNNVLKRVGEGANFLGYIVRPRYVLARQRVVGNFKSRLNGFRTRIIVRGSIGGKRYSIFHLREKVVAELRQVVSSYLGHFKHANTHKLVVSLFGKYSFLEKSFRLDAGKKLSPRYEPPFAPVGMSGQYGWFVRNYGDHCILFQVGKFVELYGVQADKFAGILGINIQKLKKGNIAPNPKLSSGSYLGGRGMGRTCGFPVKMLKNMKRRLLLAGQPYVVVAQSGLYSNGLKKRVVTEILNFDMVDKFEPPEYGNEFATTRKGI